MRRFAEIQKFSTDETGNLLVDGIVSSESEDFDGEVVSADAMRAAIPGYLRFANIREMHGASAAGVALALDVDDQGVTRVQSKIVDRDAILKIRERVYKGFSIGARVLAREQNVITAIELVEISLVDRPSNPDAVFLLAKIAAEHGEEQSDMKRATKAAGGSRNEEEPEQVPEPQPSLADAMTILVSISEKLDQLLEALTEEAAIVQQASAPEDKTAAISAELSAIRADLALLKSAPAGAPRPVVTPPEADAGPELALLTPRERALFILHRQLQPGD